MIPADLQALDQWVLWKYETRTGKATKVPCQPDGEPASTTNPATWRSYEIVRAAWEQRPQNFAGIGFVFAPGDPFVGIDLDNCLSESGVPKPWAVPFLRVFHNTYTEISPSRRGVKIFAKGKLPGSGKRNDHYEDGAIEVYDQKRFFTVTGQALNGSTSAVEDHQANIDKLYELVAKPSANGTAGSNGTAANGSGTVPQGKRHNYLVSLAGTMRRRGMDVAAIEAGLWEENRQRCKPPYDRAHIRKLAESAGQWEPDQADAGAWRDQLIKTKDGIPRALLANAIIALRHAPEWAGVLGFNSFAMKTVSLRKPPWQGAVIGTWTDQEDRLTADWLQHAGIMLSIEVAGQAVQSVAKEHSFHPVLDYLDSLQWDGIERLDDWLILYAGAAANDYTRAVGSRWCISAVARVHRPGVKADCCLILEGATGIQKTTAIETLAGSEYYTDDIGELGSKDASFQTLGVWIIELGELDSMARGAVSQVKAFMSRKVDRFRPPYGRHVIESPRQCVFAGSVNHSTYLRDETGGRRFWPVACTRFLIRELARDRDQIWAEAVFRYRRGDPWWLDSKELNQAADQEQAERYESDPWDELIADWIVDPSARNDRTGCRIEPFTSNSESTTIVDVLTHCIGKPQEQWTQADKNRVARTLQSLNRERYQQRDEEKRQWRYRVKVTSSKAPVTSASPVMSPV